MAGKQQADVALQKFYKDVLPSDPERGAHADLHAAGAARRSRRTCGSSSGNNTIGTREGQHALEADDDLHADGDYRNVRRFIYSLETTPEFIVLENVALTSPGEQAGARPRDAARNRHLFRSGNVGTKVDPAAARVRARPVPRSARRRAGLHDVARGQPSRRRRLTNRGSSSGRWRRRPAAGPGSWTSGWRS